MSIKKTHEAYLLEVAQKNPSVEVLGVYNGNKVKILHRCKICGHKWEVKPIHIIQGHKCPQCAKIQRPQTKRMSHSQYVSKVQIVNPNIMVIGQFLGVHQCIEVKCKVCGHTWSPIAYTLLEKHIYSGCKQCYTKSQTKTTEQFIKDLQQCNPYVKLMGNYVNSYTKTLFKCYGCKQQCEWETSPASVLCGRRSPNCYSSNGEIKIQQFLQLYNIHFIKEYKFEDCKNIHCLPFDFYLPQYNMCIEYDGEQHYRPINFGGCSDDKAIQSFQSTYINDNIKNQYCEQHNINLLRIPYYDFKDIDTILYQHLINNKEVQYD